jgi:hypothetical protein
MLSSDKIDFRVLSDKIHEYGLGKEWEKARRMKDKRQRPEEST